MSVDLGIRNRRAQLASYLAPPRQTDESDACIFLSARNTDEYVTCTENRSHLISLSTYFDLALAIGTLCSRNPICGPECAGH